MNVAQTLTAAEANSGVESAPKAGVKAELICAWYCSSKRASEKSGSGVLPKVYLFMSKEHEIKSMTYQEDLVNKLHSANA